jgi:hypothetical protein
LAPPETLPGNHRRRGSDMNKDGTAKRKVSEAIEDFTDEDKA